MTPAEVRSVLDVVRECAESLREVGITSVEISGVLKMELSPAAPVQSELGITHDDLTDEDALHDRTSYGRDRVPGYARLRKRDE